MQLCSELIFVTHYSSVKLFCLLTEASGVKYLPKGHKHNPDLGTESQVSFSGHLASSQTFVLPTNIVK